MDGRGQLARIIRPIRPGVIEIERYWDGRTRFFFYALIGVLLAVAVYDLLRFGYAPRAIEYAFARERVIEEAWTRFQASDPVMNITRDEYASGYDANMGGRLPGLVILGTPLLLVFVALMVPRFHPVRVDGARGLIYGWRRGRLYLLRAAGNGGRWRLKTQAASARRSQNGTDFGPLQIALEAADGSGATITPWLGTFPAMAPDMAEAVLQAIDDVLDARGSDPDWVAGLRHPVWDATDPFRALFDAHLTGGGHMNQAEAEIARRQND
ncbi:MAG: hypothetical protein AAFQ65_02320 [Myxococcota bacterium]